MSFFCTTFIQKPLERSNTFCSPFSKKHYELVLYSFDFRIAKTRSATHSTTTFLRLEKRSKKLFPRSTPFQK